MATNLAINKTLLETAYKIGGYDSEKETVDAALEEFIQRRTSEDLIKMFGQIEYDADYNCKTMRSR